MISLPSKNLAPYIPTDVEGEDRIHLALMLLEQAGTPAERITQLREEFLGERSDVRAFPIGL